VSTPLLFELGHFSSDVRVSIGHISTGINMSGHFVLEMSQGPVSATLQEKISDII